VQSREERLHASVRASTQAGIFAGTPRRDHLAQRASIGDVVPSERQAVVAEPGFSEANPAGNTNYKKSDRRKVSASEHKRGCTRLETIENAVLMEFWPCTTICLFLDPEGQTGIISSARIFLADLPKFCSQRAMNRPLGSMGRLRTRSAVGLTDGNTFTGLPPHYCSTPISALVWQTVKSKSISSFTSYSAYQNMREDLDLQRDLEPPILGVSLTM
jgi:hypothetical protein